MSTNKPLIVLAIICLIMSYGHMFELLYMRYSLCWGEDQRYGVGHLVKYISTLGLPELHKKADYMYMLYIL